MIVGNAIVTGYKKLSKNFQNSFPMQDLTFQSTRNRRSIANLWVLRERRTIEKQAACNTSQGSGDRDGEDPRDH
jgi:hypothetical protein